MGKITRYKSQLGGGGAEIEVRAPWDGSVIGAIEGDTVAGVDAAIAESYALFRDRDRWLPPAQRVEILSKAAELLAGREEEFIVRAAAEGGKPYADSKVEVMRAVDGLRSCVECVRTSHGEEIPMNITASSANRLAMTHREPIGVVLAYSAFNHPINLIVHQVGPAIAAGCPVLVKPADSTPLSCYALVELLHEAGMPREHCRAFLVGNEDAGKLVCDERIGFFSFIGSAKIGWMLRGKLAPGTHCALEHGGAAPVLVAEDADLDDALPLIAKGGFYHAGQVCVSVQRVFAHESIARNVAERLAQLGSKMKVGDPVSPDTEVGPLIRHGETDRIEQWTQEAIAAGAECLAGGKRISDAAFECTVLLNPPEDAAVSCKEIFGPVVCVYSVPDMDEAVRRANSLPFSFQSSIFTRDFNTAMRCLRRLDAMAVLANDHTAFRVDWMPFAGHRHSGYSTGGIRYTYEDMQIEKLIILRSKDLW